MHGATGNIYCGLHEFTDMAFVMHFLREGDLFLDVGANIGSYTILASGVSGARTIAIEPVAATADALAANIELNNLQERVRLERCAVGEESGTVRVSNSADCVNHVLSPNEHGEFSEIPQRTLDELLGDEAPILIKMDIEGYEYPALRGAQRVLADASLHAVLVEANGSGRRYGHSDQQVFNLLKEAGFQRATYDPFHRVLQPATEARKGSANALFLRDFEFVRARVLAAERIFILGEEL
jgi:FkbM family methyltransferase